VIDSVIRTKFTNGEVTLCNTPVNAIDLSMYALNRVKTTLEPIIVGSAYESDITLLTKDPYIAENKILSLICTPIQYNKNLKAIIYVENNVTKDSFTDHQVDMLDIVATQMGISLQNMHAFDAQMIMAQQNIEQEARTKQEIMYAKQQEDFVDRICHEIRNPIQVFKLSRINHVGYTRKL
jgi:GAF domain-containing protein